MRMEDSHPMTRQGYVYQKSSADPRTASFGQDLGRLALVSGNLEDEAHDDSSVIRRMYTAQASQHHGGMCVAQSTSYCSPSRDCVEAGTCVMSRPDTGLEQERDRRVITPDSTDMVQQINQTVTKAAATSAEASGSDKKDGSETKPPMSYIGLISKAILQSPDRRMNLGSIYTWMEMNFPYFRQNSRGWRNSVRHNLSLNDCFIKAGRCEDGKGNYWTIHPENLDDFIRGDFRLRRRSRRRGRKGETNRSEVLVKPPYQPQHSASAGQQLYVPAPMSGAVSFPTGQQYIFQDASPSYPPAYSNTTYSMYDSSPTPHGPPISPYGPWTPHPQGGEQCVDLIVPPGSHNYSHNPPHLYGYANYSYPSYAYQPSQW